MLCRLSILEVLFRDRVCACIHKGEHMCVYVGIYVKQKRRVRLTIPLRQLETLPSLSTRVMDLLLTYMCNLLLCSYKLRQEMTTTVNQVV